MKFANRLRSPMLTLAVLGIIVPRFSLAEAPANSTPIIADVGLQAGGCLHGQMLDSDGAPQADSTVTIQWQNRPIAETTTNREGEFSVAGLRGGNHTVVTKEGAAACRFWAPGTSPPNVRSSLLLVHEQSVLRGNNCQRHAWGHFLSNPYLMGAVIGAAIIIPVAISAANDDDDSGS